jgi:hypothetical protein
MDLQGGMSTLNFPKTHFKCMSHDLYCSQDVARVRYCSVAQDYGTNYARLIYRHRNCANQLALYSQLYKLF